MKSATIISKTDQLFRPLVRQLRLFQLPYEETNGCFIIHSSDRGRFTLYDREVDSDDYFEKFEIPQEAKNKGYRFGYLVECRSETLFCDVIKFASKVVDVMVIDTDGQLFTPENIDSNILYL